MGIEINRVPILLFLIVWLSASFNYGQSLASAPIQGHTTPTSIKVWFMVKKTDKIRLKLKDGATVHKAKSIDVSGITFWNDHAPVTVQFAGLKPAYTYQLEVFLDDEVLPETYPLTTRPVKLQDSYSFTMGSCALLATGFYKLLWPDKTKIFKAMAKTDTDFMLWLGDNVYLLFGEWEEAEKIQRKYTKVRLEPAINDFMRTRPQYAIWDDHDYGPDNSGSEFPNRDVTLHTFSSFWPNPYFGTPQTKGIFSHFSHQDSDFFLLDDRYHRIAKNHETMIGTDQMEWLKTRLLESRATFKFIAHGSQVSNHCNTYECMDQYPQRAELFQFIKDNRIEGVIFLSGDRHFTELLKTEEQDMYPLYEFTNSPLMSFVRHAQQREKDPEYGNPQRIEGTAIDQRNFGEVTISGPAEDRVCKLETFDNKGRLLWDYEIRASELTFP